VRDGEAAFTYARCYEPTLTVTELGILEVLMRHSPVVCERRVIARHVWDDDADPFGSNTIDVHMARVRAKLAGARIQTVRGIGFSANYL